MQTRDALPCSACSLGLCLCRCRLKFAAERMLQGRPSADYVFQKGAHQDSPQDEQRRQTKDQGRPPGSFGPRIILVCIFLLC